MNQLLPIIRRQRRPLLPMEVPPVAAVNVEPANAVASPARTAMEAKAEQPRSDDPGSEED